MLVAKNTDAWQKSAIGMHVVVRACVRAGVRACVGLFSKSATLFHLFNPFSLFFILTKSFSPLFHVFPTFFLVEEKKNLEPQGQENFWRILFFSA